jgi:hypothetical protein
MSLTSVREIAAIHEIVAPWLRVRSYSQASENGGLYPEGPYSFEADIQVDPDAPLGAEFGSAEAARNVRAHLLGRAQDALDVLEAAGWHPAGRIQVEVAGSATRIPDRPSLHGGISARVRFTVDKDRSEEEMAMDPEVIATRLLGPLM